MTTAHVHIQVREVAKGIAGDLYERLMGDNPMFERWKKQNPGCNAKELERRFIEKNWPKCIEYARQALAALLRQPHINEETKLHIVEVLAKDQSLVRGRHVRRSFHRPGHA